MTGDRRPPIVSHESIPCGVWCEPWIGRWDDTVSSPLPPSLQRYPLYSWAVKLSLDYPVYLSSFGLTYPHPSERYHIHQTLVDGIEDGLSPFSVKARNGSLFSLHLEVEPFCVLSPSQEPRCTYSYPPRIVQERKPNNAPSADG